MNENTGYELIEYSESITVKPQEIILNITNTVKNNIISKFENTVLQNGSYVIKIIDINSNSIKNGTVNELNGYINFNVIFYAFVFNPIINSTFNIIITKINDIGIWGYPELCPNSCIECITSTNMFNVSLLKNIKIDSVVKFKTINKKTELYKMTVFGTI